MATRDYRYGFRSAETIARDSRPGNRRTVENSRHYMQTSRNRVRASAGSNFRSNYIQETRPRSGKHSDLKTVGMSVETDSSFPGPGPGIDDIQRVACVRARNA